MVNEGNTAEAYQYVRGFLMLADVDYGSFMVERLDISKAAQIQYLQSIIDDKIIMVQRTGDSMSWETLKTLYYDYIGVKPGKIKLSTIFSDGKYRTVESSRPVIISKEYLLLLEHLTKDKFSACSIGHTTNLGIPSNNNKHKSSTPKSHIKFGEMEKDIARLKVSDLVINRYLSTMSGNPLYRDMLLEKILFNPNPFQTFNLPYDDLEITNDVPSLIISARLFCAGLEMADNDIDVLNASKLTKNDMLEIFTPLANAEQRDGFGIQEIDQSII